MVKIGNISLSDEFVSSLTKKEFVEKYKGKLNADINQAWQTIVKHKKSLKK